MSEPFIPFYKPYGMSDEQYAHEISNAHQEHERWALEQQEAQLTEDYDRLNVSRYNLFRSFPIKEQERIMRNELIEIQHWFGGWDELAKYIEDQRNSD